MSFDFELLSITDLIVHRVYERTDEAVPEPRISSSLTKLDAKGLTTLQNRIVKALGSGHHGVEMDIRRTEEGTFFRRAAQALQDNARFIEASGMIAVLLNEAQATRRLPGGIVVVIKGKVGIAKKPFIAVIKAEVHEGFSAKESDKEVVMSFIDSLALTPNQKLYKIGLLAYHESAKTVVSTDNPDVGHYRAFLYDHNMTAKETRTAASYFYSQFLGFDIRQSDKKLTRDFYELTRTFVAKSTLDDEKKMDVQQSLYVELKASNKATIQFAEFAENYLPPEIRDDYGKHMTDNGFPSTAVTIDTDYIARSLRRRKLHYSSDVVVSAPSDSFDKLVTLVVEDAVSTTIRIVGKLKILE